MKVRRHHLFNYSLFTIVHKYSIVKNFKEPIKTTEIAIDTDLNVLENSHGNVCSEVLSKVLACQHGIWLLFGIKIFPRFSEHRSSFLEVLYRSCCSALMNDVMKYLHFRISGSKLESITCKFHKNRTPSQVFFKEFHHKCRPAKLKNVTWCLLLKKLYFGNILEWLLL